MKFIDLNISEKTQKAIKELGFTDATEIQEKTLQLILDGEDVIGQAQTGTGKTAAFGIPIIENCDKNSKNIEHIIIAPTRELADQIVNQIEELAKYHTIKIASLIGGVDYNRQKRKLDQKPQIIVGTPGRIQDHIKRKNINLSKIKTFVLDEADEMLKQGFKEEIDNITSFLPDEFQSLLFSATLDKNIQIIAEKIMTNPKIIKISSKLETKKNIEQSAIYVDERDKFDVLRDFIILNENKRSIIFGRTKRRVGELANALQECGVRAYGLHGDLSQRERTMILDNYRRGKYMVLVATDVAARGIDIDDIEFVYNFDLPQEIEYYVHRIGRTGRANKNGSAITFLRRTERSHLIKISKETSSDIKEIKRPTKEKLNNIKQNKILMNLTKISDKNSDNKELSDIVKSNFTHDELANIVLNLSDEKNNKKISLTPEPAVRIKGSSGRGGYQGRGGSRNNGSRNSGGRSNGSRNNGNRSNGSRNNGSGSRSNGSKNSGSGSRSNGSRNKNREYK